MSVRLNQLGKDHEVYGEFAAAAEQYQLALPGVPTEAAYRHDLIVRLLFCLKCAGELETAILLAEQERERWSQSPDFFFVLGDLLLEWALTHQQDAEQTILPMVEAAWMSCLEIGEQPGLEGTVQGRGSFLAAHNLAVLHAQFGRAEQAARYQRLARAWRGEG